MHDADGKVVLQKEFEAGQTASFTLVGSPAEDFNIPTEENVKLTITGTKDPFDGTYSYNATDGSLTVRMTADITVTAVSKLLEWYEDKAYINSLTEENVGETKTVKVNGVDHTVHLIGVEADIDETGNKIHTTWEFANVISDENGYSLATYWKNTNTTEGSNSNYLNSSVRKALTGQGEGDLNWFQYFGTEHDSDTNRQFSTTYADTSVLDMLPSSFTKVLKTVKKIVNVKADSSSPWTPTEFTDKLFLLSTNELNEQTDYAEESEAYLYYKNAKPGLSDSIRFSDVIDNRIF